MTYKQKSKDSQLNTFAKMEGKIVAFSTSHLRHVPCTMTFKIWYPHRELDSKKLLLNRRIDIFLEYISAESGAHCKTSLCVQPGTCMNGTRLVFIAKPNSNFRTISSDNEDGCTDYELITDIEIKK